MSIDYEELRERARRTWSLGDYARLEPLTMPACGALLDALQLSPGEKVLDVAAGTGNLAIAAAHRGVVVVASDLAPAMVERGRARAAAEGVEVEWVEADAEDLPFEDRRFDCAASVFGAMFAPRPDCAARELFRVVRPGGTVAMANWTPSGFPGRTFTLNAEYVPPPQGLPRPVEWGVEETVRERLSRLAESLRLERRSLRWDFASPEAMLEQLEGGAGPSVAVQRALEEERLAELRGRVVELIGEFNQAADASVVLECEYLLVVARRPSRSGAA